MRNATAVLLLGAGMAIDAQVRSIIPDQKSVQACQNTYTELANLMERAVPFLDQAAAITSQNQVRQLRNIQLRLDPGPSQYSTYDDRCTASQLALLKKNIDQLRPLLTQDQAATAPSAAAFVSGSSPTAAANRTGIPDSAPKPDTRPAARARVASAPVGADISIDGRLQGSTPSLIKLTPGSHTLRLSKEGYVEWERTISLEPGELKSFSADLERVH